MLASKRLLCRLCQYALVLTFVFGGVGVSPALCQDAKPAEPAVKAMNNAEARAKRRGDKASASRGADKSEVIQVERMDASAWTLTND